MSDLLNRFKSRRVERLPQPPKPQPSAFQLFGGWCPPGEDTLPSDGEARREGARALAALYEQRDQERRDALDDS